MTKTGKILAIIPARGGSKRIKNKNFVDFCGKPLISWTIDAAKLSVVDEIVVSSDDRRILEIAERSGVLALRRPDHLASDDSSTVDVLLHALETIEGSFDYVLLLQPTSPLRNENHINKAISTLISKHADGLISVTKTSHSPLWANTLPIDGDMSLFLSENVLGKRSQDLPQYYCLNGAIFICRTACLINQRTFFLKSNVFAFEMERSVSVDIDDEDDLDYARFVALQLGLNKRS